MCKSQVNLGFAPYWPLEIFFPPSVGGLLRALSVLGPYIRSPPEQGLLEPAAHVIALVGECARAME